MKRYVKAAGIGIAVLLPTVALLAQVDGEARSGSTIAATPSSDLPGPLVASGREWSLAFEDEFDRSDLDSRWATCFWWQVDGGCTIASNDEQQWYQAEAVEVSDGVLRLHASADSQQTSDGRSLPFRSGLVSTGPAINDASEAGFTFTYGYVEAVVQFPTGAGTWPAVWLLSADLTSTPEIDIVEHYGDESVVKSRVHQRIDGEKESQGFETALSPTADGWHRVAVLWTDDRVEFYLDDVLTGTVDDSRLVPQTPMYLIMNLAMGGPAGPVDEGALPQQFAVDSIRVWQQLDGSRLDS